MARKKNPDKLGGVFGNPGSGQGQQKGAGGYGVNQRGAKPAVGTSPAVNPFVIPKASGLTQTSNVYPSQYFVNWDITTWRFACDQAIKQGYAIAYATLTTWAFERSPFIQSLFNKLGTALDRVPFFIVNDNGEEMPEWSTELCNKPWNMQLRKEILFSYFWGFSGLNFDPVSGKIYKYPQQQIDPINRLLKADTFAFYDGMNFEDTDNLLFVQPSTNYESFLGWMQPITAMFIEMNQSSNNWISAGRRIAFPVMTVGYPEDDGSLDPVTQKPTNNYKNDAILLARNMNPQEAQVYPYTYDGDGNMVKSVVLEFEKPGTAANMHKIYQEFNSDAKSEIEQMIFGRSMTQGTSKGGNRALGEVEERALDDTIAGLLPFVLAILNDDSGYKAKIATFYKNLPKDWSFGYNNSKQLTFADMEVVSNIANANGKRLTNKFFEDNGFSPDFFEDAPIPTKPIPEPDLQMAGLKKKFF